MPKVRLIDANALFNDLKKSAKAAREWREGTQDEEIKIRAEQTHGTFVECALRVKNATTIEAEPVRHGQWRKWENGLLISSCCYGIAIDESEKSKYAYCPKCGARMDGGADNG